MELSDRDLVQKCQAGEMNAFQELVSRYHQKVYMVILGLLRNREDAQEVAQETFFRAFRKIDGFQGESSFYTWIYRIAVNKTINVSVRPAVRHRHHAHSVSIVDANNSLYLASVTSDDHT